MTTITQITQDFVNSHSFRHVSANTNDGKCAVVNINGKWLYKQAKGGYNHYSDYVYNTVDNTPSSVTDALNNGWNHFSHGQLFSLWNTDGAFAGNIYPLFGTDTMVIMGVDNDQ
jgi:hypothetical protein